MSFYHRCCHDTQGQTYHTLPRWCISRRFADIAIDLGDTSSNYINGHLITEARSVTISRNHSIIAIQTDPWSADSEHSKQTKWVNKYIVSVLRLSVCGMLAVFAIKHPPPTHLQSQNYRVYYCPSTALLHFYSYHTVTYSAIHEKFHWCDRCLANEVMCLHQLNWLFTWHRIITFYLDKCIEQHRIVIGRNNAIVICVFL